MNQSNMERENEKKNGSNNSFLMIYSCCLRKVYAHQKNKSRMFLLIQFIARATWKVRQREREEEKIYSAAIYLPL